VDATPLPGGLLLRTATPADVDAIARLAREVFGPEDEPGVRAQLGDPRVGPGRFTVVTDGDRVVSSLCLLAPRLSLNGVELGVGQVEYVLTDPAYRRRGLVRRQMEVVQGWSAQRGDLVQLIEGIPYFYRRFGYEYALAGPRWRVPAWPQPPVVPAGHTVRTATPADVPALARLRERAQRGAQVVRRVDDRDWALLVDPGQGGRQLVVEASGEVRGSARLVSAGPRTTLRDLAVDTAAAGAALLTAAVAAPEGERLVIADRPGTLAGALLADLTAVAPDEPYGYYVRVTDPLALLRRLRPVLSARLAASPLAGERGELVLTFYTSTVAPSGPR